MKIAVIGAGIVGITTAFELACDGHEVHVFDRHSSIASEGSFANGGIVAPGDASPWLGPVSTSAWATRLSRSRLLLELARHGAGRWAWHWWRSQQQAGHRQNMHRMHRLTRYSQTRMAGLTQALRLDHERSLGHLILLRSERELKQARRGLGELAELGERFELIDADRARHLEPGLSNDAALRAAVHLPLAGAGNCRQFAQLLKQSGANLGIQYHLGHDVLRIQSERRPQLIVRTMPSTSAIPALNPAAADAATEAMAQTFDAVVLCAAAGAAPLLAAHGLRLPVIPMYGYSITLPQQVSEAAPELGPRGSIADARHGVTIARIGQRIRVAGGVEFRQGQGTHDEALLRSLYRVLEDWFPGAARVTQAQHWRGARPSTPDGPPLIGRSSLPGIWLNLGHGANGWAMSCGSARILADLMDNRTPELDPDGLSPQRWLD